MRLLFRSVFGLAFLCLALWGCDHGGDVFIAPMEIHRARVEELGSDFAVIAWDTTVPANGRVDFALVAEGAAGDEESVSDELYIPKVLRDGGVTIPDPALEHVSNTVIHRDFRREHRLRIEDLLPGRTYAASVASSNLRDQEVWELGVSLLFTTNP